MTTTAATVDTTAATDGTAADTTIDSGPEPTTEETAAPEGTDPASDEPDLGEFQPIEGVPGVTDETVSYGVVGTGPSNPLGYCLLECYVDGIEAYFEYRNELGGVHGRELALSQVLDDELANNQVKTLELINAGDAFGAFFAPVIYAGLPDLAAEGVPTYTVFPASPEANGIENVYVPSGTLCLNCPRPLDIEAARIAGATKVARCRLRRVAGIEGLRREQAGGIRQVGPGGRHRVRVRQRRARVRSPQRHRPRGHRDEGRRRRLHPQLHRPEQRADDRAGARAPRHGQRDDGPPPGVRRHRVHHDQRRPAGGRPPRRRSSVRSRRTPATP